VKALVVCISVHHGNTEKIAASIARALGAELRKPKEVESIQEYGLIGFGSGIYYWRHHKALLNLVDRLPDSRGKRVFIFSTSGIIVKWLLHRSLKKRLLKKGFDIVGEFFCKGFDTNGPLKLIGGINKGRPNETDIRRAGEFGRALKRDFMPISKKKFKAKEARRR
jgi:flavodoxin